MMATKKGLPADRPKSQAKAKSALGPSEGEGFGGFGSQALQFLQALRENNDREWFAISKATYLDECDAPLRALVAAIGVGLKARGIPLAPSTKAPVFRIYRDVRFGHNKDPYKTNIGAALYPDGDKTRPGLLYVHVEPGRSFLAAGFHQPDTPRLRAIRAIIAADPAGFASLVATLEAGGLHLDDGEPLIRLPRGFEEHADSPIADALRKRSFITTRPLTDDDLGRRELVDITLHFAAAAHPLLAYFQDRLAAAPDPGSG